MYTTPTCITWTQTEIIPTTGYEVFTFDLEILGFDSGRIQIEGKGYTVLPIEQTEFAQKEINIAIKPKNKEILKYRICPAQ